MIDKYVSELAATNVLLLGISYPCVESQMAKHGLDPDVLVYKEASVEQAVECVRRNILTEMDARDLARCVAVEKATNTTVYTVSREIGAVYNDRHINCDFNTRNFCKKITDQFGEGIQFSQVILDYYWMPTGWLVTRWAKTLFQQTLPDLVRHEMLIVPSKRKKTRKHGTGPPYDIDEGVVFLPFCAHVCKELVGAIHILEQYYEITFLDKKDLHGHSLWKGTMEIDPDVMQHRLGKRLDQEEIYCKFRPKDIYESMEDPHVSKPEVMRILLAIKNYDDVRMVRLRPLRQHERANVFRERMWHPEVGGFKGLDFKLAAQRMKEQKKGRAIVTPVTVEEDIEEDEIPLAQIKMNRILSDKAKKGQVKKAVSNKTNKAPVAKVPIEDDDTEDKEEEDDDNDDGRHQFFPGTVRDLETYTDTRRVVTEDVEELAAFQEMQRLRQAERARAVVKARRALLQSPSDHLKSHRTKTRIFSEEVKTRDYLSCNPRVPFGGPRILDDSDVEFELNWSVIPEKDLDLYLESKPDPEDDKSSSESRNVVVDPFLTDDSDLKVASNLYYGLLKGFTTPNRRVDGVERITRFGFAGESYSDEIVCFSVDGDEEEDDKSQYKGFTSKKIDQQGHPKYVEVCDVLSRCFEGRWERICFTADSAWIKKKTTEWPIQSIALSDVDGMKYHIKIDRQKNLRTILQWMLFEDGNDADDLGYIRSLIHQHGTELSSLSDMERVDLAVELEKQMIENILAIVNVLRQYPLRRDPDDTLPRNILQTILDRLPSLHTSDAARTMLSLRLEHEQPRRTVVAAVDSNVPEVVEDVSNSESRVLESPSDALDLLHFHSQAKQGILVSENERLFVPEFLFHTLEQFTITTVADDDGLGGRRKIVGPPVVSCRHCCPCMGDSTYGRFRPDPRRPFSEQEILWRSVISHAVSCEWCPSLIKDKINKSLKEHLDSQGRLILKDVLQKSERFFETLQCRVIGATTSFSHIDHDTNSCRDSLAYRDVSIEVVRQRSRRKCKGGLPENTAEDSSGTVLRPADQPLTDLNSNLEDQTRGTFSQHLIDGDLRHPEILLGAVRRENRELEATDSRSLGRSDMESLSLHPLPSSTLKDSSCTKNEDKGNHVCQSMDKPSEFVASATKMDEQTCFEVINHKKRSWALANLLTSVDARRMAEVKSETDRSIQQLAYAAVMAGLAPTYVTA